MSKNPRQFRSISVEMGRIQGKQKDKLYGCSTVNFGSLSREHLPSPDVNHCVLNIRPQGHWEPYNKVGSLSPGQRLVGLAPGTFQFSLQCLNARGHSPQLIHRGHVIN